jgi:hypothetical protein
MLRRVAVVRIVVPEERIARIIKTTRIGALGTTLAVTSNRNTLQRNIMLQLLVILSRVVPFWTQSRKFMGKEHHSNKN